MKFGISVQPTQKEVKSIVPSHLLSDPAFSSDLRCNPYSDSNKHFAWDSPPQGHPILKSRYRVPPLFDYGILASANWDFQLVQPPNSPVSHTDGGSGIHHQDAFLSFPQPTLNTAASSVQTSCSTAPASTLTATPIQPRPESRSASSFLSHHPQPSALKQGRKRRMHFLSRRKTIQATPPGPTNVSNTLAKSALLPSEHTFSRASSSRSTSQPVVSTPRDRPILPPRAASSGTSTPRSTLTAISKRAVENRNNDLDRIDELDETSPLGLSLHHDGPYEAASQAIKRGVDNISLGSSLIQSTSTHMYGMQAYGKPYVPPQAPFGVSLNLLPGQVLPRNFGEPRVNAPPPRMRDNRENAVRPPRMQQTHSPLHPSLSRSQSQLSSPTSSKPPRHMYRADEWTDNQSDFSWNRRQSLPPPSPFSPLPNPHPVQPELAAISRPDFRPQHLQSQVSLDSAHSHLIASNYSSDTSSLYQSSLDSRHSFSGSSNSRRHSQHLPRTVIVSSNPSSESSHRTSSSTRSRKIESVSTPNLFEPPEQEEHAAPIDIGMAMLHSEQESESSLVIPAPRIYLPHGTPDSQNEFNPYDPRHLQNEHERTPSPLALAYDNASHNSHEQASSEPSRRPSPTRSLEVLSQAPARPARAPERPVKEKEKENPPLLVWNHTDPPPYTFAPSDGIDFQVHEKIEHEEVARHLRVAAEGGSSLPLTNVAGLEQTLSQHSYVGSALDAPLSRSEMMAPPAFVRSVQLPSVDRVASIPSEPSERQLHQLQSNVGGNGVQSKIKNIQRPSPAVNQAPALNQGAADVIPMLPARRSRERLVPPPPSTLSGYEPDRDARSTHQSFSTGSSGHPRSGPPPRRHVPKHLVMPAPLDTRNVENAHALTPNTQHNILHSQQAYMPPRQIPPRRAQVSFKPQAQVYYPPPSSSPLSMVNNVQPMADSKPPTLEAHIQIGRKLKKKVSVLPPTTVQIPPPPAKFATVSFTPPVVGYDPSGTFSKPGPLSRSKTEKSPKKVLSKRRADL